MLQHPLSLPLLPEPSKEASEPRPLDLHHVSLNNYELVTSLPFAIHGEICLFDSCKTSGYEKALKKILPKEKVQHHLRVSDAFGSTNTPSTDEKFLISNLFLISSKIFLPKRKLATVLCLGRINWPV